MIASVTSCVVAVPPRSGVLTPDSSVSSMAVNKRLPNSFSPKKSSIIFAVQI